MLLIILEAAISSICSSTSLSSTVQSVILVDGSLTYCPLTINKSLQTEEPCFDFTRFIALLGARLDKVNWLLVAALFRILHIILKYLKNDNDDLEDVFSNFLVSYLTKIPWDIFGETHVSRSFIVHMNSSNQPDEQNGLNGIKGVLLGRILQLLCSLARQNCPQDMEGGHPEELAIHSKFVKLVPRLLHSCFFKCLGHNNKGLSQYLRHKMLVSINSATFLPSFRSVVSLCIVKDVDFMQCRA